MIDVDVALWVEYDDGTKEPLALIETAVDRGQDMKPATVIRNLARRCNPVLHAYVLLYRLAAEANPADARHRDIDRFRVRRIWPPPETAWHVLTPRKWAEWPVELRARAARQTGKAVSV